MHIGIGKYEFFFKIRTLDTYRLSCEKKNQIKGKNKAQPWCFSSTVGPAYRCDNHTEFVCKTNYRCVPLWSVCNGQNDCRDNSDEQGCGESLVTWKQDKQVSLCNEIL